MKKKHFKPFFLTFISLFFLPMNVYAYGSGEFFQNILIIFLIFAVIFFILREVMCWYWKINERISLLEDIRKLLESNQNLYSTINDNQNQEFQSEASDQEKRIIESFLNHKKTRKDLSNAGIILKMEKEHPESSEIIKKILKKAKISID